MRRFSVFLMGMFALLLAGCQSPPAGRLNETQIALLKARGFTQVEEGWSLGLSDRVLFANESRTLNPDSRAVVQKITHSLLSVEIDWARLDGHTDSNGDESYNQQLSRQRAQSVADSLIDAGMPVANLEVRGLGERYPVASNKTREGRSQNRRVAIVITD